MSGMATALLLQGRVPAPQPLLGQGQAWAPRNAAQAKEPAACGHLLPWVSREMPGSYLFTELALEAQRKKLHRERDPNRARSREQITGLNCSQVIEVKTCCSLASSSSDSSMDRLVISALLKHQLPERHVY